MAAALKEDLTEIPRYISNFKTDKLISTFRILSIFEGIVPP